MDATQLMKLNRKPDGDPERPRAPAALFYIPPAGKPIACVSVEQGMELAETWAGEHPGKTVAVYQLVGYAFKPVENPQFTPADSEKAKAELLSLEPDDGCLDHSHPEQDPEDHPPERPDLTDAQREQLDILRRLTRES